MMTLSFLIFLVALLVHGAPTGGGDPIFLGPGQKILLTPNDEPQKGTHSVQTVDSNPPYQLAPPLHPPRTVHSTRPKLVDLLNPMAPNDVSKSWLSPKGPHSSQTVNANPPPYHLPHPYLGQTVAYANQSPHQPFTESTTGAAHSGYISRLKNLPAKSCRLQKGTKYRLLGKLHVPILTLEESIQTSASGIFFTLQGDVIFAPEGTTIELSNQLTLPADNTEIKVLDKNDPRLQAVCIFPEGTTSREQKSKSELKELTSSSHTRATMFIITPQPPHQVFYLPAHITVITLPGNIIRLPPNWEEIGIRTVSDDDKIRIVNWCTTVYIEWVPAYRTKKNRKMDWAVYERLCFEANLWRVWNPPFITVHVGV